MKMLTFILLVVSFSGFLFGQETQPYVGLSGEVNLQSSFPIAGVTIGAGLQINRHEFEPTFLFTSSRFDFLGAGLNYKLHWFQGPRVNSFLGLSPGYYESNDLVFYGGKPVRSYFTFLNIGAGAEVKVLKGAWLTGMAGIVMLREKIGEPLGFAPKTWYDSFLQFGIKYQIGLRKNDLHYLSLSPVDSVRSIMTNLRAGYSFDIFENTIPWLGPEIEIPLSHKIHLAGGLQFSMPVKNWWGTVSDSTVRLQGGYVGIRLFPFDQNRWKYYLDLAAGYVQTFYSQYSVGSIQIKVGNICRFQATDRLHIDLGSSVIYNLHQTRFGPEGSLWTEFNVGCGYRFQLPYRKKTKLHDD